MYRKCLSSLLSFSLLLQVVWIPAAFARPIEESGIVQEAENEIRASLEAQSSKVIWDKIDYTNKKIYGNSAEDERMAKWQEDNDEYDKSLVDNFENSENWSLRNFIFQYYVNLNKRKRPALIWGAFDSKLRYMPFDNSVMDSTITSIKNLGSDVEAYLETSAPEFDRITIATWYMLNIYGKMIGQLSLFAQERDVIEEIKALHSTIRLRIPYSLATKYKDNLNALEIMIKNNSSMPFMGDTYLEFTAKMQLDLYTLASAQIPSAHFYLNASRFRTLKNILKRVDFYKLTLNDFSETEIPRSCQTMMSTLFPSSSPVDEVDEEERLYTMNAMLAESGLLLHNATPESNIRYSTYEEYHKGYYAASTQMYEGGFSGLLPYEDYFASQAFLSDSKADLFVNYYTAPQINDVEHFDAIIQGKAAQIEAYITKKSEVRTRDLSHVIESAKTPSIMASRYDTQAASKDALETISNLIAASYAIEDIWKKMIIFDQTDEYRGIQTPNGATIETAGLNHYLAERMIKNKTNILEDVVPDSVKEKMRNKKVRIRMPHVNSSDTWRKWAMQLMVEFIDKYIDADLSDPFATQAIMAFSDGCFQYESQSGKRPTVCTDGIKGLPLGDAVVPRQIMKNIRKQIMPDESEADILPRLSYDMNLLNEFYPVLQRVWDKVQGMGILPDATVTEWEYLVSQLPYNGWAVLRLSHLLIEDDLNKNESTIYETKQYFTKISKILGLDKTFAPFHANRLLSKQEKQIFWRDIEGQVDENNFFIYKNRNEDNDKPYYEIIRHINDLNLFNDENLNYALRIIGSNVDKRELNKELDIANGSEVKEQVDHLNEMYNNMGDLDKLQEMADNYFDKYPYTQEESDILDTDYNAYIDVKSRFLKHESNIKTPIYHHALKESSYIALEKSTEMMDRLCNYEYLSGGAKNKYSVEREGYNDLFAITSKAHVEFNQEFQVGVPTWAQKYADRMSDEDWKAMYWAFGSAILYLVSIPLTGGATLGLTPVAAAALSAGISIGAAGVEFLSGGIYEWQVIEDAKKRTSERESFREFGTMNAQTNEKIGYSYLWVALEVCFFSQLLGQVLKGVKLFTRTVYATKKGLFKGLNAAQKLAKYRGIARRVMTSNARSILSLNRRILNTVGDNWFKNTSKALKFEYLRGFKGAVTPVKANANFAMVFSKYFEDSSDQFRNFLKQYPQNRVAKFEKKLAHLNSYHRPGILDFFRNSKVKKVTDEIAKFSEGTPIVQDLMRKLSQMPTKGGLEKFVLDNIDDICKVSKHLGWKQWQHSAKAGEVFYHVLITGVPAGNKRLPVLRNMINSAPWLATINDRILIQRLISAREILLVDYNIKMAAKQAGMTIGDTTKFALRKTIEDVVDLQAKNGEPASINEIAKLWDELQEQQADQIIKHYSKWNQLNIKKRFSSITRMQPRDLKKLLAAGDPKAIAAYNNTPAAKLFSMEIDNDSSFDVIQKLSEKIYDQFKNKGKITVEEFEILVNALKMRSIAQNPKKYFPELKYTI